MLNEVLLQGGITVFVKGTVEDLVVTHRQIVILRVLDPLS